MNMEISKSWYAGYLTGLREAFDTLLQIDPGLVLTKSLHRNLGIRKPYMVWHLEMTDKHLRESDLFYGIKANE
jgi:phage anti-repressor protein